MIALDTNLLIYAHRSALPEHRKAKNAIERVAASRGGWCIPSFCITEFWAVVTHPKCAGRPSLPEEASAFLSGLIDAGAKVLYPRDGFAERLTTHACELRIEGPRIFDLQIALVSYDGGAREIWTHDRSFCSLPGLPFKDPL